MYIIRSQALLWVVIVLALSGFQGCFQQKQLGGRMTIERMIDHKTDVCRMRSAGRNNYAVYEGIIWFFPGKWETDNYEYNVKFDTDIQSFIVLASDRGYVYERQVDLVCELMSSGVGKLFLLHCRTVKSPSGHLGNLSNGLGDILHDLKDRMKSIAPNISDDLSVSV